MQILIQRQAQAQERALEDVYEDLAQRGLNTERIEQTRRDPTASPEYKDRIIISELASALVHERLAREALGRVLAAHEERIEALEASKRKK